MGAPSLLLKSLPLGFTFSRNLFFAASNFWQSCRVNITTWSIWERPSGSGDGGQFLHLRFCFQSMSVVSTSTTVTTAKKMLTLSHSALVPIAPSFAAAARLGAFLTQVSEVW